MSPVNKNPNRVLVVGGSSLDQEIYLEQLSSWGMDACATPSFLEAQKVYETARSLGSSVDLIIIDQDKSSPELEMLIKNIRKTSTIDDLPILAIGPNRFIRSEISSLANEISAKLLKPCAPSKLEEGIVKLLNVSPDMLEYADDRASPSASDFKLDVLIAEDNEVNQIVFKQILLDLGVEFKIANNGQEAVELWEKFTPAVVLMDVSMPVMNGHEATREIRRLEQSSNYRTPICAITAHALRGDKEDCIAAGMDDYISKPVSPDVMINKIKAMLPSYHGLSSRSKANNVA
ncbi:MAG: response regulator [Rhizobiaceae bacterium]|nr:response regulator [Rhizobiaceae bacterium]